MKPDSERKSWKVKMKDLITTRIPILSWMRNYSRDYIIGDIVAGITICLTMVPQSIAYAALANLEPQYGLNSAFIGCFVYVFFGNVKEVIIGPSSLMALMTYEYTQNLNIDFVILLAFLCGVVEFAMAVFRLGFVVELFSVPVVSTFTTATGIVIMVAQLKGLLGIRFKSVGFVDNVKQIILNIQNTKLADLTLGISCIVGLILIQKLNDISIPKNFKQRKIFKKSLWFISICRNAIIVLISCGISLSYIKAGRDPPFNVTGQVNSGLPSFQFPPISTQIGNKTYDFQEMVMELGSGIIIIPIISIIASVAIAKAYGTGNVDATQEMLALSLCNMLGSCLQSMPTAGAFTRSAVITASGVRTPLAGLYSAGLTLLAYHYLAPFFYLIPRATLAAVLITAITTLIDFSLFLPFWKNSKIDFYTTTVSFICSLWLGVEIGLLIGILIGVASLIYLWTRNIIVQIHERDQGSYIEVTPNVGIYFLGIDHLCTEIKRVSIENGQWKLPVVVNCSHCKGGDFTAAKNFQILNKVFEDQGQDLIFLNIPSKIRGLWQSTNYDDLKCCTNEELDNYLHELGNRTDFGSSLLCKTASANRTETANLMGVTSNDGK